IVKVNRTANAWYCTAGVVAGGVVEAAVGREGDGGTNSIPEHRLGLGGVADGGQVEQNPRVVSVGHKLAVDNISVRIGDRVVRPVRIEVRRFHQRQRDGLARLPAAAGDGDGCAWR